MYIKVQTDIHIYTVMYTWLNMLPRDDEVWCTWRAWRSEKRFTLAPTSTSKADAWFSAAVSWTRLEGQALWLLLLVCSRQGGASLCLLSPSARVVRAAAIASHETTEGVHNYNHHTQKKWVHTTMHWCKVMILKYGCSQVQYLVQVHLLQSYTGAVATKTWGVICIPVWQSPLLAAPPPQGLTLRQTQRQTQTPKQTQTQTQTPLHASNPATVLAQAHSNWCLLAILKRSVWYGYIVQMHVGFTSIGGCRLANYVMWSISMQIREQICTQTYR